MVAYAVMLLQALLALSCLTRWVYLLTMHRLNPPSHRCHSY